jgi:hypothetical protein
MEHEQEEYFTRWDNERVQTHVDSYGERVPKLYWMCIGVIIKYCGVYDPHNMKDELREVLPGPVYRDLENDWYYEMGQQAERDEDEELRRQIFEETQSIEEEECQEVNLGQQEPGYLGTEMERPMEIEDLTPEEQVNTEIGEQMHGEDLTKID